MTWTSMRRTLSGRDEGHPNSDRAVELRPWPGKPSSSLLFLCQLLTLVLSSRRSVRDKDIELFVLWHQVPGSGGGARAPGQPLLRARSDRHSGALHLVFHDLRRVNATVLVAEGIDLKTAQTRLGHSDPRLTMAVHAQATSAADRDAADRLAHRLLGRPLGE
jgi:integrase